MLIKCIASLKEKKRGKEKRYNYMDDLVAQSAL